MGESLQEQLGAWHDFYVMVGTAGATLAGLVFVAVSLGSRLLNSDNLAVWRTYTDPPLLSFATSVAKAGVLLAPTLSAGVLGAFLCLTGAVNVVYSALLARRIRGHLPEQNRPVGAPDWLWRVAVPLLGSALTLVAGASFLLGEREAALIMTAFASLLVLLVGVRNAWDMVLWIGVRTDNPGN